MNKSLFWRRVSAGVRAFLFVIVTLAAWWTFASLADNVLRCVPWGSPWGDCRPLANTAGGDKPARTRTETALLAVTLLPALWVAQQLLFSSSDLEDDPVNEFTRLHEDAHGHRTTTTATS